MEMKLLDKMLVEHYFTRGFEPLLKKMQNSPLTMDHRTGTPNHMTPSPMDVNQQHHVSTSPHHTAPHHLQSGQQQQQQHQQHQQHPPMISSPQPIPPRTPLSTPPPPQSVTPHPGLGPLRLDINHHGNSNQHAGMNLGHALSLPQMQSLSDHQILSSPPVGSESGKEKTYCCPKCFKYFRSKQQLAQHHLVHSNERKHHCVYCDKSFKQLSHLQQHTRIHTGEKPYKCTMEGCERAFAQLSNLQHHHRNHESQVQKEANRPHKCGICHRGYSTDSALKNHTMKMHIHIKPLESRPIQMQTKPRKPRKKKIPDMCDRPTMVPMISSLPDSNGMGIYPDHHQLHAHLGDTPKDNGSGNGMEEQKYGLVSSLGGHPGMASISQARTLTSESALNYSKDIATSRPMSTGTLGDLERGYPAISSHALSHHNQPSLENRHSPHEDRVMSPLVGNGHLMPSHLATPRQHLGQSAGFTSDLSVTTAGYRPYLAAGQFSSHLHNTISIPANADLSALANHMIRAAHHQSASLPPSLQFPLGGH